MISAWSSGTGAAGVAGSLTYAALIYIGFTPKETLLLMLIIPLMQLVSFALILKEPHRIGLLSSSASSSTSLIDHTIIDDVTTIAAPPLTFQQKIKYAPKILKYVLPLLAVYVSEYFINQGLVNAVLKMNNFSYSIEFNKLKYSCFSSLLTFATWQRPSKNRFILNVYLSKK